MCGRIRVRTFFGFTTGEHNFLLVVYVQKGLDTRAFWSYSMSLES